MKRGFVNLFIPLLFTLTAALLIYAIAYLKIFPKPSGPESPVAHPQQTSPAPIEQQKQYIIASLSNSGLKIEADIPKINTDNGEYISAMDFNGNIYYSQQNSLEAYSLLSKSNRTIFTAPAGYVLEHRINYLAPGNLFITLTEETQSKAFLTDKTQWIWEIDSSKGTVIKKIGPFGPTNTVYTSYYYLGDLYGENLVINGGGDACMGFSTIYRFANGKTSSLLETGSGCSDKPDMLGYDEKSGRVLLASVVAGTSASDTGKIYNKLSWFDLKSQVQELVYDLKSINHPVKYLGEINNLKLIYLVTAKNVYVINIKSKNIQAEILLPPQLSSASDSVWIGNGNYLYAYVSSPSRVVGFDLSTSKTFSVDIDKRLMSGNITYPNFLGIWKDKIILTTLLFSSR